MISFAPVCTNIITANGKLTSLKCLEVTRSALSRYGEHFLLQILPHDLFLSLLIQSDSIDFKSNKNIGGISMPHPRLLTFMLHFVSNDNINIQSCIIIIDIKRVREHIKNCFCHLFYGRFFVSHTRGGIIKESLDSIMTYMAFDMIIQSSSFFSIHSLAYTSEVMN